MIKNKLSKLIEPIKGFLKQYKITIVMLFVICVLGILSNETKIDKWDYFNNILIISILLCISAITLESVKITKWGVVILTIVSIVLGFSYDNSPYSRWCYAFVIINLLYSIYKIYTNKKDKPGSYIIKVVQNYIKYMIIYVILQIGINFILLIVNYLIIKFNNNIYLDIQIILLCLYFIPSMMLSLSNTNAKVFKFSLGTIKYLLIPIYMVATTIIYIYAVKILFIAFPSNEVFSIISCIYVYSFVIWLLKDEVHYKVIDKYKEYFPYTFIILLIIQVISLFMRISNYGITPSRYFGMFLVIIEIISLIYYYKKKDMLGIVYPLIIIVFISLVFPFVNYEQLSNFSQFNRLKIIMNNNSFDSLSLDDKDNVKNIYNYLYLNNGDKYLSNISDIDKKSIREYSHVYNDYDNNKYYSYDADKLRIDVSAYREIEPVNFYNGESSKEIKNFILIWITKDTLHEDNVISLDNKDLYVSSFWCYYSIKNGKYNIDSYNVSGYYLYK